MHQDLLGLQIIPCPDRLLYVSAYQGRERSLGRTHAGALRARIGRGLLGDQESEEECQRQNPHGRVLSSFRLNARAIAFSGTMASSRSISARASSGFPSCT